MSFQCLLFVYVIQALVLFSGLLLHTRSRSGRRLAGCGLLCNLEEMKPVTILSFLCSF